MPTAKKRRSGPSGAKTGAKRAAPRRKKGQKALSEQQRAAKRERTRQTGAIAVFFAALLFAAVTLIRGDNLWRDIHNLLFGLFGACAFAVPVLMLYIAVAATFEKPMQSIAAKLAEAFALLVLVDSAVQVFTLGRLPKGGFAALYSGGVALRTGGVAGGLVGAPLCALFGRAGAGVTVVLLSLLLLMLVTDVTLARLLRALRPRPLRHAAPEAAVSPTPAQASARRPRYNIDIPLGEAPTPEAEAAAAAPFAATVPPAAHEPPAASPVKPAAAAARAPELDELVQKAAQNPPAPEKKPEPAAPAQQRLYSHPPVTLLEQGKVCASEDVSEELKGNAARLVETLRSFGVETRITDICRGPAVTRYELQPSAGVKISRITSLADDIALNLASAGVRIEAPIPNKAAVGIEVPNRNVNIVTIREIVDSAEFRSAQSRLTMALGRDIAGNIKVTDISKMPHLLIAGATGSGKSVCINSIIVSLLYKASPEEVKFLMVDPKVVELGVYNGIPHLLVPVVTDPGKAAGALGWAVTEMLGRYKQFADAGVRDIRGFNKLAAQSPEREPMPNIVIIIDELSDLMMAAPKDVEDAICRLAQMARAAGMHLVIATQRPSVDVITGVIKANIPSRIAFAVSSQVDSRTILDMGGAEKLLGRGDMLFLPMGASKPVRVQGCFVTDAEVEAVTSYVKQGAQASYDESVMDEIERQAVKGKDETSDGEGGDADDMLPQAIECVVEAGMASTSLLQRRLKLGYARAARIVDQMEQRGIVGPFEGSKPRQVLLSRQQWAEMQVGSDETGSVRG